MTPEGRANNVRLLNKPYFIRARGKVFAPRTKPAPATMEKHFRFHHAVKNATLRAFSCCGWFFLLVVAAVPAQESAPAGFERWTEDALRPYLTEMTAEAPSDPHRFAVRQLADFPNDSFLLVHREGDGQVEWHETQADVFFVKSGSAVLLLGGQLVGGETVGPHEKRNGKIIGGVRQGLCAGDIVRIPPRVPHQVLLAGSKQFDYVVVKIKGY